MIRNYHDKEIRILFLADTHIGYDWPTKPRIQRRRRGDDFFNNYLLALKPAFDKQVDLVIHGGDLLNRSRLPEYIVHQAFKPLLQVADLGIPVYVVPGNHERSVFRLTLFEQHPLVYLFDQLSVFHFKEEENELLLCGFPFFRGDIRSKFPELMKRIFPQINEKKTVLLCVHHPFDGAKVGTQDFTFYQRPDTINPMDIPLWIDGVLSGHIHRRQVIRFQKDGYKIPVYYPGSIERTSFAERNEDKGYFILSIKGNGSDHESNKISVQHIDLPARPMYRLMWDVRDFSISQFKHEFDRSIQGLHPESIVRIVLHNHNDSDLSGKLTSSLLRKMTPATMNVEISINRAIK